MSIIKALIVQPCPCPFCNGESLELRAVVFRQWNIQCLKTDCRCKGPNGKTPDQAVIKWNSLNKNCINQRKNSSKIVKDYQTDSVPTKIWKAIRTLGTFTIEEVVRLTEFHHETVKKYISLLENNKYLRRESDTTSNTKSKTYRCIKPRTVKAPSWFDLQLSPREYQIYRREKKTLKWNRIQAVTEQ